MTNLDHLSPLAWIVSNNFVTENQKPLEFQSHRFLIEPYADMHPDIVCMKSAQVGFSVLAILKTFWLAAYGKMNVIYVLPNDNVSKDFVAPKVDALISSNEKLRKLVQNKDSITLKQLGDRFIYYRGAFSEAQAISITADLLVLDEYDRMPKMSVVNTYDSRLQASDYAWRWRFSNPSVPGFGVSELFADSDQRHWIVTCHHCGHKSYMDFDRDMSHNTHYIEKEAETYNCGSCLKELTTADRINGEWVAKYPSRDARHGYWMSQMMAPWVTASRIMEQYRESSPEFFHNFVLGKPYIEADILVDREALLQATTPQTLAKHDVVMGTDNGIEKHYVIGTPNGVFRYGKTESWEELEELFLMYNMKAWVIDANPYPTVPKKLTEKYPGKVFINYYVQDRKSAGIVRWGLKKEAGVVQSDRTKIFDFVAQEIRNKDIQFAMKVSEMEGMIEHWTNMYRVIEEDTNGMQKSKWMTKENRPDHWAHATIYWRTALAKVISGGFSQVVGIPTKSTGLSPHPIIKDSSVPALDINKMVNEASQQRKRGWK